VTDELKAIEEVRKKEDAISETISEKIIAKTSVLVEEKKQECNNIIEELKRESQTALVSLEGAIQKLKILHEGNVEKTATLDKQYHDALSSITVINAKLEVLKTELVNKMNIVEKGFLQLFETDEKAKANQKVFQETMVNDRRQLHFLIKKVLGSPFDDDETNKNSLVNRIVLLERECQAREKRTKELLVENEKMKIKIATLEEKIELVEKSSIAYLAKKAAVPVKKVLNQIVIAFVKSLMIKLLLLLLLTIGALHTLQDYVDLDFLKLFLEDLF